MAQRHEIEAWVNPTAWDDQDEAQRVIDAIEASGTDDEAEWVRIAGGGDEDVLAAAEREHDRREQADARRADEAVIDLQRLAATRDAAADDLRVGVLLAVRSGALSEVRAAEAAGISRTTLRSWLGK